MTMAMATVMMEMEEVAARLLGVEERSHLPVS